MGSFLNNSILKCYYRKHIIDNNPIIPSITISFYNHYIVWSFNFLICNQIFGYDVKSKGRVKTLSKNLLSAIKEEENINQNIDNCIGELSSNVGKVLKDVINGTL